MTGRDLAWRGAGLALTMIGCAPGIVRPADATGLWSALTIAGLLVAIAGIVLMIHGRRVAVALRIERSRHRQLPSILRTRRRPRS